MADTSVKYFHSAMPGAPVLSGTAGSRIAMLDACLVNGFGLGTLDSLVIASGVATATIAAGHSQEKDTVALIAGATVSGGSVNGEQKVLSATATTFTFAATGIGNQTATGTITQKLASAGWSKVYSGTNLAVYKSTDVTSTGCYLRVNDTAGNYARVIGYETMSGVNTGTGPFPTNAQQSGGLYWSGSSSADSTSRSWMLVADKKIFYTARNHYPAYAYANEVHCFGDIVPTKTLDPYGCVLFGNLADYSTSAPAATYSLWQSSGSSVRPMYSPRSYTGLGSSAQMRIFAPFFSGFDGYNSGSSSGMMPYPNGPDGGLYVSPVYTAEHTTGAFRGAIPGAYLCPQSVPDGQFAPKDSVVAVAGLPGKTLKAMTCDTGPSGVMFFDVTGPWR